MKHLKYAWSKLVEAKAWWDEGPPEPTYDKNVRVKTDNSLGYIVGAVALLWLVAQLALFIDRAL